MAVQASELAGPVRARVRKRRTVRRKLWKRRTIPRSAGTAAPSGGRTGRRRGGDRLALQFAVCGGAFVLLVAAKLLLPGGAAALRQSLGGAMERNVDVQAVFSAVGRAVSGEENGAEKVWQAVFSPLEPGTFSDPGTPDGTGAGDSAGNPDGGGALDGTAVSDGGSTQSGTAEPYEGRRLNGTAVSNGAEMPDSVQPENLTAVEGGPLPDGTAYTVQPGQGGQALDVLRQYRPGKGDSGQAQTGNGEPPQTGESSGGQDADTGGADSGKANGTDTGGADSGEDGGAQSLTRSGSPVLPEKVSMEQVILNFNYRTPVFGTLTSGFGLRVDPIQGKEKFHHGVDLAAPSGTDILCFADGTVAAVGESTSYGKYCIVDHAGGCSTLYAHCGRISASSGAAVSMGEKIGEVGSTGAATGPHLHFELHKSGTYLNPIYYVAHD